MGREEQKEEREVLDSIFPDEITDVSETEYRVCITLDVTPEPGEELESPSFLFQISYPEDYPDVAPNLDLLPPTPSDHASQKSDLIDIPTDKAGLLESLQPTIDENMGMAMVFTLVSALKDDAETLISERQASVRARHDEEKAKVEEEENRKFYGTMVTRERFLAWREKFRNELEEQERRKEQEREAEEKKKRGTNRDEKKLSGKELWERGLAGRGEEDEGDFEADGISDATEGVEKLKVEA